MASIIISKKLLIRQILSEKPQGDLTKLSSVLNELDRKIRVAEFDLGHGDWETVNRAKEVLAKLQPEYAKRSELRSRIALYLETKQLWETFKRLVYEKKILVSITPPFLGSQDFQQQHQLDESGTVEIRFLCGHTKRFKVEDILDLTSLRSLCAGKSEVGLGNVDCQKGCKRDNVFSLYLHKVS